MTVIGVAIDSKAFGNGSLLKRRKVKMMIMNNQYHTAWAIDIKSADFLNQTIT